MKVQRTFMSLKFSFRALTDAGGFWFGFGIFIYLDIVKHLWFNNDPNFGSLSWLLRCKEHQCPLSPFSGHWRTLEVPDWGLACWSWFGYGHWSWIQPWSKLWLSILIFKVQRTTMSFKSGFGALEVAGGSWMGFGILIMIWIWSLVFDISMIQILALYLDFEGAKNINVLQVLIWGFSWHLYLDFEGAKNIHVL